MSSDKSKDQSEKGSVKVDRRKVVHAALLGGATATVLAPTKWTKPVVDSVILPAHAVTSEVDTDGGMMPVMRTFFGGVPLVVMNYPAQNQNEVQIADASAENDLLGILTDSVSSMLIPEAHAQFSSAFSLCVDDNNGSLSVTLESQLTQPSGVVHYTGSGGFGSSITLTTSCVFPEVTPEFSIVLTDTNNGMVGYSITSSIIDGGPISGMIPETSCGLGAQVCPVFEQEKNLIFE